MPRQQVFILFDDDTVFEFYGDDIQCTKGIKHTFHTPEDIANYMPENKVVLQFNEVSKK